MLKGSTGNFYCQSNNNKKYRLFGAAFQSQNLFREFALFPDYRLLLSNRAYARSVILPPGSYSVNFIFAAQNAFFQQIPTLLETDHAACACLQYKPPTLPMASFPLLLFAIGTFTGLCHKLP
jgi:hypothetical protein